MKRAASITLRVSFILAFVLFLYLFGSLRRKNIEESIPVSKRVTEFSAVGTAALSQNENPGGKALRAKINPEWDETFLEAIDLNLDEDEELEQVVVARPAGDPEGRISIIIADFQPSTGNHFRLWKGETLAVKPNAFVLQPRDLLGDGQVELLCFGLDKDNNQTLTIFRRGAGEMPPYYTVFSRSGVSISIESPADRTADAAGSEPSGREAGALPEPQPPTILLLNPLDGNADPEAMRSLRFSWKGAKGIFDIAEDRIVERRDLERAAATDLTSGSLDRIEGFLEGVWTKGALQASQSQLIGFSPRDRQISFRTSDRGELWNWNSSNPAFTGLYASISHATVPELVGLLTVEILGQDSIRIRLIAQRSLATSVQDEWSGSYTRYAGAPGSAGGTMFRSLGGSAPVWGADGDALPPLTFYSLQGGYLLEDGSILRLEDGIFIASDPGRRGRYSVFSAGAETAIEFRYLEPDSAGLEAGTAFRSGLYRLSVRRAADGSIAALLLDPAEMRSESLVMLHRRRLELSRIGDQGSR